MNIIFPHGFERTSHFKEITPCKKCGKTTERMYPFTENLEPRTWYYLCEDCGGKGWCCSNCFEPYYESYPEREEMFRGSGHCAGYAGCACHGLGFPHRGIGFDMTP